MLRSAIQRSAYHNHYGLYCLPSRRFACALYQTRPRLNSTAAAVYNPKDRPAGPDHDGLNVLLQQRPQRQQQKEPTKKGRKAEALLSPAKPPKRKRRRKAEASPSPSSVTSNNKVAAKAASQNDEKPKRKPKVFPELQGSSARLHSS